MAKENKTGLNGPATENVVETTVHAAPAEQTIRKEEKKHEIELLYGQCIVAPVGKEDDEILTTIDDWNSLYNAGDNQGRFVLKAEKKS
jgi:hypothetical protein